MRTHTASLHLLVVRILIGWLLFYAGITKVINPAWSAAGYLKSAKTFPGFFAWLASDGILPFTNFLNEWGLTLVGLALIFGMFTRISARLGACMMLLYWLPALDFPAVEHGFLVDDHVIYAAVLWYLATIRAGRKGGIDGLLAGHPWFAARQKLRDALL